MPLYTRDMISPVFLLTVKTRPPLVSTTNLELASVMPKAANAVEARERREANTGRNFIVKINSKKKPKDQLLY